ncbi:MAG TPA: hypothetical protein VHY58_11690 [Streptosporangiaceae bacterium]|nr:hypothetical protein [Streptosporangiaceae bacterium]
MNGRRWLAGLALLAAVTVAGAGCASVTSRGRPDSAPRPPLLPGLDTSIVTSGGSWAVAVLGGSAAADNNFWQLFARPAGSAAWRLVTPPGVASNGGLVAASPGGRSLVAAFRPSQDLVFSPLASTGDDGASWSSGVLDAGLADTPGALAASPGGGRLLALLSGGEIEQAGRGAANWSALTSLRSLAASAPGRRCGPAELTAVAFTPAGTPLAAGACARAGVSGLFSYTPGTTGVWHAAGPALPAAVAGRPVRVLRLTSTAAGEVALLAAGTGASTGAATDLLACWRGDSGRWTVSAPLALADVPAGTVRAAGFSAAGGVWVLLGNGQADMIARQGAAWQPLPLPPSHTTLLAFAPATTSTTGHTSTGHSSTGHSSTGHTSTGHSGTSHSGTSHSGNGAAAGGMQALGTFGSKLTVWSLTGSGGWRRVQTVNVPVQYGSSG